jgi:hypothetical protein
MYSAVSQLQNYKFARFLPMIHPLFINMLVLYIQYYPSFVVHLLNVLYH